MGCEASCNVTSPREGFSTIDQTLSGSIRKVKLSLDLFMEEFNITIFCRHHLVFAGIKSCAALVS